MTIKHLFPPAWPTLNLDFANSKALDPRITFTRASTGTYVDADGIVQTAVDDEPRFDHSGEGESLGLLIEESRTNYIPNSTDFTGWAQISGASIALSAAVTAPDGGTASNLYTADDGAGYAALPYTIPGDTTAYLTLFVKAASENVFQLSSSRTSTMRGLFDMTTGLWSSTAGSADDYTAEAYPNGWWKLTVKGYIAGPSTISLYVQAPSVTTAGTDAFYMWGCQIEHGSFPTSYIPTAGAAATRAADLASITGTNFSSWYNQDEGTILSTFTSPVPEANGRYWLLVTGGANSQSNGYRFEMERILATTAAGSNAWDNTADTLIPTGYTQDAVNCTGFSYDRINNYNCFANNGTIQDTNTSATDATMTPAAMTIGAATVQQLFSGTITRIAYYPTRLSDEQLQALTS